MIAPNAHIARMASYPLADARVPEGVTRHLLAQNESLRPPSPQALAAAAEAVSRAALYPDSQMVALRDALGEAHGIAPADILVAAGSLELIAALARAYAGPGRAVLVPRHAYPYFRTAAALVEARIDTGEETGHTVSVDALFEAVRPDTRLVFVANPGNPTGTRVAVSELARLRNRLPADCLLVIDEAYGEFSDHLADPAFALAARGDTVVLRTFSKAYGLAGLRIGWGLFPSDIARETRKALTPGSVSAVAQAAALGALADGAYMRETVRLTADGRAAAAAALEAIGLPVVPSITNFLLIDFGTADAALGIDRALRAGGVVARLQAGADLPGAIRLTIGPPPAMGTALSLLRQWAITTP